MTRSGVPESTKRKQSCTDVLVLPRETFRGWDRFVRCETFFGFENFGSQAAWLPREQAEKSRTWVQTIPCALIRNHSKRYLALRRIRNTRADLKSRVSLLVGGHVDAPASVVPFAESLVRALFREIEEEVRLSDLEEVQPIGVIIDPSSIPASRHIAFVYEVSTASKPITKAREEFSSRSKYSGRFYDSNELSRFHAILDPWSAILFEDYISSGQRLCSKQQTQMPFMRRVP